MPFWPGAGGYRRTAWPGDHGAPRIGCRRVWDVRGFAGRGVVPAPVPARLRARAGAEAAVLTALGAQSGVGRGASVVVRVARGRRSAMVRTGARGLARAGPPAQRRLLPPTGERTRPVRGRSGDPGPGRDPLVRGGPAAVMSPTPASAGDPSPMGHHDPRPAAVPISLPGPRSGVGPSPADRDEGAARLEVCRPPPDGPPAPPTGPACGASPDR